MTSCAMLEKTMKHLHLQFVLASFALGLGFALVLGAAWNVHALTLAADMPWNVMMSAWMSTGTGIVLIAFGYHGVRKELYGAKE